jgi:hypothetical protein
LWRGFDIALQSDWPRCAARVASGADSTFAPFLPAAISFSERQRFTGNSRRAVLCNRR